MFRCIRNDVSGLTSRVLVKQQEDMRPRSRGALRPRLASAGRPPKGKRAQGKPGARCTRGPVCVLLGRSAHEHTGSAEAVRLSLRNGLRLIPRSPGRPGLLATLIHEKFCFPRTRHQRRGARTTRLHRPQRQHSSFAAIASTASHRTFATIMSRPSHRVRRV